MGEYADVAGGEPRGVRQKDSDDGPIRHTFDNT